MKRSFCLASVLLVTALSVHAQDAANIIESARNRIDASTTQTRIVMVITSKNGSTTERVIDRYEKDDTNGRARSVIVFQSPAAVKNTRFLTLENADGENDQWIFLPELGRVRRISASEGGSSFMGTDMSYNDMSLMTRDVNEDTHALLREESYNGAACYVVQSVSRDSSYQYSKVISWIDKANCVIWKAELYGQNGRLAKTLECSELETNQGYLAPKVMTFSTLDKGTSTTVTSQIIKYDANIPESAFTTQYLETGRAR